MAELKEEIPLIGLLGEGLVRTIGGNHPREHAIPCFVCKYPTWNLDRICDVCISKRLIAKQTYVTSFERDITDKRLQIKMQCVECKEIYIIVLGQPYGHCGKCHGNLGLIDPDFEDTTETKL